MFFRRFIFGKEEGRTKETGNVPDTDRPGESRDAGGDRAAEAGCTTAKALESLSEQGTVRVTAQDFYTPEKGYGFVVEENRRENFLLQLPELNSAFDTLYWYRDENLSHVKEDEFGCYLDSEAEIARLEEEAGEPFEGEHRRIPLSFKLDVPHQGNYRVTLALHAPEAMEDVLVFTGRRRLGYRGPVPTCPGGPASLCQDSASCRVSDSRQLRGGMDGEGHVHVIEMTVNVCDIIPRGQTEGYEDKSIDITVLAPRPGFGEMTVEELECPTLFIAGDSTVTDQSAEYPYAPGTSYSGWGQMISGYLDGRIAVSNHAHSGLTTASFREEGHYGIVERYIRPGDYLLIQFAHNDQKLEELKAWEGYRDNLLHYISECRERGVFPALLTPIARNTWKGNDGSYNDLLEEYAAVCIAVGEQEDIPVVDLHGRSMDFIVKKGLEASRAYFFPGDYTHSNDYGAYFMAGLVAEEIVRVCKDRKEPEYRFLAECVTEGFGSWEPAAKIVMPVKPGRFEHMANPEETALLSDVADLAEPADRASALDMVIKTARFFPTNVYNDMFRDVVGHEWYAGAVECAYQNGMIDPGLVEDGRFFPLRPVTLEEFLIFAINGYKSRRALPEFGEDAPQEVRVYDDKCRSFARPYIRAACSLGLLAADGSQALDRVLTRGEAVEFCRRLGL